MTVARLESDCNWAAVQLLCGYSKGRVCGFLPFCICVTERKFMCPTQNEAKQYQNIQLWGREGLQQVHARFVAHALKTPEPPTSFQQSPFLGKVRKAHGL